MSSKIEEVKKDIEDMLIKNRENIIVVKEPLTKYKTITSYKDEIGISPTKTNILLEKMGLIERPNKKEIFLTEKGKQHGLQLFKIFVCNVKGGLLISQEAFVRWKSSVVDEIKKFLEKGEEKNGDTK